MKENFEEYKITPGDEENMEKILKEAKELIYKKNDKNFEGYDEKVLEEIKKVIRQKGVKDEVFNSSNEVPFLVNFKKGTNVEIFFRVLVKEIPQLEILIDEGDKNINDKNTNDYFVAKINSSKNNLDFVKNLMNNKIVVFFTDESRSYEERIAIGLDLEGKKVLEEGTTYRFLFREYNQKIKDKIKTDGILENKYNEFKNLDPLSDKEIEDFLLKVIKAEKFKYL